MAARKKLEQEEARAESEVTEEELDSQLETTRRACTAMEAKLVACKSGNAVSKDDVEEMRKQASARLNHWKIRKRVCDEICLDLAEKSGMKLEKLHDEMGVETDEATGVSWKQSQLLLEDPNRRRCANAPAPVLYTSFRSVKLLLVALRNQR